ncbi:MAG TPA: UDP-glucose 4-epimerase GalE [bacterium]|nr:UDP-glucose 4-epimerase GalE [bacterium]
MILIAGGAGYIGAHTNKRFYQQGQKTIVLDNLSYGHQEFARWGEYVEADIDDIEALRSIFKKYSIEAVMHFCAFTYVGESVSDPYKYYVNNVANTLNLLQVMREFDVKYFVFSSTCATYGEPQKLPLTEDHPQAPINPYGESKLMVEHILRDFSRAYGLNYVALRYFNAAGADPDAEIGEWHEPETHLIPLVLDAALGKRENIKIFGTDYDTPDGTCVRDYIHVFDLADAHILALEYLKKGGESTAFNLGNGSGYSVRQVIDVVRKVTSREIAVVEQERREGDPPVLVGGVAKAQTILGWQQQYPDLETIISTAWKWHEKQFS